MPLKKLILTDWEYRLMRIIWNKPDTTANDVVEGLREEGFPRSNSAIRKTLRSMEEKGYIEHKDCYGTFVYSPLIKQDQVEKKVINYLRELFFGGSTNSMLIRIIEESEVSPETIKEMQEKLKAKLREQQT